MGKFLIGLLVFAGWALGSRYYYICQIKGWCAEDQAPIVTTEKNKPPQRATTLTLAKGDSMIIKGYEEFGFDNASHAPILTENNKTFLKLVADYLKLSPTHKIQIIGRYLSGTEEKAASGIYENLGLARAASVKDILIKEYGVNADQLGIESELLNGTEIGAPLKFMVPVNDKKQALAEAKFEFTNMTYSDANFEYNSAEFKPGTGFQAYADSVKTFLTQEPNKNKKLIIIGHTDSKGGEKYNMQLGLRRSKSVKGYFEKLGVKSTIETQSKGLSEPIAPNTVNGKDSPENRAKNRRVNVQIK
jgi:OOP family OmpA-OmpF porin